MTEGCRKRRWYQFSLRTLLVAVLVLSLPLSWIATRLQHGRRQRRAVKTLVEAGCTVWYTPGDDRSPRWRHYESPDSGTPASRKLGMWRGLLDGDDLFNVWLVCFENATLTNVELDALSRLDNLEAVHFRSTPVTDEQLRRLLASAQLRRLVLIDTGITDRGASYIGAEENMNRLLLWEPNITDVGVRDICQLSHLEFLHLWCPGVTEAALPSLRKLDHLQQLTLGNTAISEEASVALDEELPGRVMYFADNPWAKRTPDFALFVGINH